MKVHPRIFGLALLAALTALALLPGGAKGQSALPEGPSSVRIVRSGGKNQLLVNGASFFIRGAGGGGPKSLLVQCGGNSFRTWGIGPATRKELDEAQRFGLRLTLGVWLGHKEHGFNYDDAGSVQKQKEQVRQAVLRV